VDTFEDVVGRWLRTTKQREVPPDFRRVVSVKAYGTDWAGDTEGGFYSTAEVRIQYEQADGTLKGCDVEGDDMQSLWEFVMGSWPTSVEA
jgi:hypothetical protein